MRLRLLVLLAAVALVGCGVSTDGAMDELEAQSPPPPPERPVTPISLTTTPGAVIVAGLGRGTLTPLAARSFRASGATTAVELQRGSEAAGFSALCTGSVDLVDSSRRISPSELAACRSAGLRPVQFQIASDAVVVATKSGVDVGADCATVDQIRQMFRAGSPAYDWSQLGFAEAPLHVTGPDASSSVFRLFGQAALGSAEPSLIDVRSDYRVADDRARRRYIVGATRIAQLAEQRPVLAARLAALRADARRAHASLRVAAAELRVADRQVTKGIADGRTLAAQLLDQSRADRAATAASRAQAWAARADAAAADARDDVAAAVAAGRRVAELRGRVGAFRFSYYELFEDQLRPVEVDAGTSGGRACVFPSRRTVTDGSYPLARQLLITTTTAGLRRPEVQAFLGSYLSGVQQLATKLQLVPLSDEAVQAERTWAAGTQTPPAASGTAVAGSVR